MARRPSKQLPNPVNVNGYAYVRHPGLRKRVYLGRWGSIEADAKWRKIGAEYLRNPLAGVVPADGVTVAEVMAGYCEWLKAAGKSINVLSQDSRACVSMTIAYGELPIGDLGPLQFRTWAQSLADPTIANEFGWSRPRLDNRKIEVPLGRKTVKAFGSAVLRAIRWGVANELYTSAACRIADLEQITLSDYVTTPRPKKRYPADPSDVTRAMEELTPTLATAVAIQRLTGMRSTELLSMRPMDIRRGGVIQLASGQRIRLSNETANARKRGLLADGESFWAYIPQSHKTEHHGIDRIIPIVPAVQKLLETLPGRNPDQPYISPKESTEQHRERQRYARKTKVQPSQIDRSKPKPKKSPTDQYQQSQYRQAILRACDRAGVPRFSPHQIRHAVITSIVDAAGHSRGAQQLAGHKSVRTTEGYTATTMAGAFQAAAGLAKRLD